MLVLTRKLGQRVVIGENVQVTVLKVSRNRVRLGISGPPEVSIHREELSRAMAERRAAADRGAAVPLRSASPPHPVVGCGR